MTRGATQSAEPAVSGTGGPAAGPWKNDAWQEVRADDAIQFEPVTIPEQKPPDLGWLDRLFEWLENLFKPLGESLGLSWPIVKWVLIGLAAAGLLWLLWRMLGPLLERAPGTPRQDEAWTPQREEALALLEEADRLAAEGRYDEATHLLLRRSVGQIAAARPDWVEPSSTARELAALPALPEAARGAFRVIAERVERSLFALRQLGREDWVAARAAYAEFALQKLPGRSS